MAQPGKVLVRFSVISFAPKGTALAVAGGCPELGDWRAEDAPVMRCRLGDGRLQSEPDFHWVDVALPADVARRQPPAEYKFVERAAGAVRWEDLGTSRNRQLELDGERAGEVFLLPVEKFGEGGSESDHTARFYSGVKERGEISVRRVSSQIFIGSCPRATSHLDYLKSLGVTAVANFQTEEDCMKNCVAGIGMESNAEVIKRQYDKRGMMYIWMPTADMSTEGRIQMLPKASHLFAGLLRGGHVVYSHCNAGVGRSVSAVCGYLTFVLGLSLRQMQHVVASSRPAAFFDFEALHSARPQYEADYGAKAAREAPGAGGAPAVPAPVRQPGRQLVRFSALASAPEAHRLALVGGCAELGDWKTEKAVAMERMGANGQGDAGLDFHWVDVAFPGDVRSVPAVEYKFVERGAGGVKWEEFGVPGNRRLELNAEKAGDVHVLPAARFGEISSDDKHRQEAMALLAL